MSRSRLIKKVKNDSIFYIAKGLMAFAAAIPLPVGLKLGAAIGRAAFFVLRPDRAKVLHHLKIAFPDSTLDWRIKIGRESFSNLGRNFFEVFHFDEIFRGEGYFKDYIRWSGVENMQNAKAAGKGGIMVTGHIGNWEMTAAYASHCGLTTNPIVRELYDPRIDNLLNEHRRKYDYAPILRGGQGNFEEIANVIQSNKFLGLLIDQDTKVRGTFAPFMGRPAHTPTGPAYLAYSFGLDVMVGFVHREPDGRHILEISEPIPRPLTGDNRADVHEYTRLLNDRISDHIRRYPTEWVWMHRRWKKRPPDEPTYLNPDPKPLPRALWKRAVLAAGTKLLVRSTDKRAKTVLGFGAAAAPLFLKDQNKTVQECLDRISGATPDAGDRKTLLRRYWEHQVRTFADYLLLKNIRDGRRLEDAEIDGYDHLENALSSGTGAVFIAMHFGAFEIGPAVLARRGAPIGVTNKTTNDKFFSLIIERARALRGVSTYAPDLKPEIYEKILRRRESLVFYPDAPVPQGENKKVRLFGRELEISSAPFDLAAQTGAVLFLLVCRRRTDGKDAVSIKPLDNGPDTGDPIQKAISEWETVIAGDIAAWTGIHRLCR